MSVIDSSGRVFGRINLIDGALLAFLLLLIPIGYATFLLFRPSKPTIERVVRVDPTTEEHRVGGDQLMAKLKVSGSGFNPMLRARVGGAEAIAFVFENPNSADVLVGRLPPGQHDLVLYDGVQEVARARSAVEIVPNTDAAPWVRLSGWMSNLDAQQVKQFDAGRAPGPGVADAFRIIASGPVRPARTRITAGALAADLLVPDRFERAAELMARCDGPLPAPCVVNGSGLRQEPPFPITLAGGIPFLVEEVGPPTDPRPAIVRMQLDGGATRVQTGDRDLLVAPRAAEVIAVAGGVSPIVTLRLGADDSREGWRYRGQLLTPGAPLRFRTARAVVNGHVIGVDVTPPAATHP
jgi:hypothetical protein